MKRLIQIVVLIIIAIFLCTYFIRNNERVNIDAASVYVKKTGSNYELYRNGKPFYIQGASGDSYMKELKDAGANTFRVYDTINIKKILDEASQLDLAVIVDLMLPRFKSNEEYYKDGIVKKELLSNIIKVVESNKNHPALLMWNFNEIEYPHQLKHKYFRTFFGNLVDEIHNVDSNHPISTSITGSNKKQIASLKFWCPQLDLISVNVFGGLAGLEDDINKIKYLWNGAYYLSEWGINGPWEESDRAIWMVPIEKTSTEKATDLVYRYKNYMPNNDRCIGNLAFFWGQKQERTHTWFSMFSDTGERSKSVQELEKIWGEIEPKNRAPELYKMSINKLTSYNNIILNSGDYAESRINYFDADRDSLTIKWELYPENWNYYFGEKEVKPIKVVCDFIKVNDSITKFKVPSSEGPYRLFGYVYDNKGNFATANVPFYVLTQETEDGNK